MYIIGRAGMLTGAAAAEAASARRVLHLEIDISKLPAHLKLEPGDALALLPSAFKIRYTYTHTHIYICIYTYIYICMYVYIYIYIYIYMYICMYIYKHTLIHTHTHTHKYIYIHVDRVNRASDGAAKSGKGSAVAAATEEPGSI